MSWLSDRTGIHVKVPVLREVGGVVDKGIQGVANVQSNPWVQGLEAAALGATGVGAPAAAAILAASGGISGLAKKGSSGAGDAITGAIRGGAAGYGGASLGSGIAKALPVVGSVLGGGSSAGTSSGGGTYIDPETGESVPAGTPGAIESPGNYLPSGSSGGGSSVGSDILGFVKNHAGDIAGAIGDFAKKYGTTALEAYSIYQAAQRQQQADQYAKDALATGQSAYDAKAPLRAAGMSGLLDPSKGTPDLSNLRALATSGSGNPFAKALPVAGVATSGAGYDATGKLNGTPSLPVAGLPPLHTPDTSLPPLHSAGNPLPPGADQAILNAAKALPVASNVGAKPAQRLALPVAGQSDYAATQGDPNALRMA